MPIGTRGRRSLRRVLAIRSPFRGPPPHYCSRKYRLSDRDKRNGAGTKAGIGGGRSRVGGGGRTRSVDPGPSNGARASICRTSLETPCKARSLARARSCVIANKPNFIGCTRFARDDLRAPANVESGELRSPLSVCETSYTGCA